MAITLDHKKDFKHSSQPSQTVCCHCGEDIEKERIQVEEKIFCCEGCRMVWEILNTNNLSQYYEIESRPGINLRKQKRVRYTWLEDEEIIAKLVDFQNDKITKITFSLPQIHCASCIWLLENLYKLEEGIVHAKVDFLRKEAYFTIDNQKLSLRKLTELLALIGYAPTINYDKLEDGQKAKAIDRTLYYQLGTAGFAFGNIMLLSFPEYLGLSESLFKTWFGYLNILLALPVVFYSGRDYLKSAFHGLKQKHLNIDVPISLGILTLLARSTFEILTNSGAGYLDSLAGLVFFLLIGKWFQQNTYYKLSFERDYKSYFPIVASIKKANKEMAVSLDKLAVGDRVIVRHKELIPADGMLLRGKAKIDYSFVTGESEAIQKKIGEKIFAGGRQIGDTIELTLTKKVAQSYLTQLWNDGAFDKNKTAPSNQLANRVGKWFTFAILTIAFATLFYWLPKDIELAINAFTAVLIIACPCAVALSIPFTFGNVLRLFGRNNFYLKNTQVVEDLANIDTIVFDKTGTITNTQGNKIHYKGRALTDVEKSAIRSLTNQSNHPISRLITTLFAESDLIEMLDFEEIEGVGLKGFANDLSIEIKKGTSNTSLFIDGDLVGEFILQNSYRTGLKDLIEQWNQQFDLYLLSGDNDNERSYLEKLFPAQNLHFNQSPKDKLHFIKKLQKTGKHVLMLGDGLNDAGALQQSEVGIVIAENTNNFTPACDAVLNAKQFEQLPQFLGFSKKIIKIVYVAYILAFIYNIIGLSFAVQGLLSPVIAAILMPLSSVTIVAFGVGMSTILFRQLRW